MLRTSSIHCLRGESFTCCIPQDGPVYTDGSCFEGSWGLAARAGYAAVQVDGAGNLVRALYAPVPAGCPQTAAFAGHPAVKQAAGHSRMPIEVAADCSPVVKCIMAGPGYATHYKRPVGGIWRHMQWGSLSGAVKVKAHAEKDDASQQGWLRHWMGNDYADTVAKMAASMRRLFFQDIKELGKERVMQARFLFAAATIFSHGSLWTLPRL